MSSPPGPPYASMTSSVGGVPTVDVDVPIAAVFLALFLTSAVANMTILQINNRRGHKFLISGMLFGFSMARSVTMIMRIVWACYPHNASIAIAASIFAAAGVLLLYVANLLFTQRILRATHPTLGWSRPVHYAFMILWFSIAIVLAMVITVVVQSAYSLNPNTHAIDRDIQIWGQSYFIFFSFLPIPIIALATLIPRKDGRRVDKFGAGKWRTKIAVVIGAAVLLVIGRCFIATSVFSNPRPRDNPAWFDSKAVFWTCYFTIEIIVVLMFVLIRVDKRFHVPNGSQGTYGHLEKNQEKTVQEASSKSYLNSWSDRLAGDEDLFSDEENEGGNENREEAAGGNMKTEDASRMV